MSEEELLKAEIAKLTGAIQTHKHQSSYVPPTRGKPSYRGGAYRGSRNTYPNNPVPPRNRTLILNDTSKSAASQANSASSSTASGSKVGEGWVKRKSTHNLSLLSTATFEKQEPARLAALAATQKARADASADKSLAVSAKAPYKSRHKPASSAIRRGDNMGEVVIDGVVFEFDPSGTKLVKKTSQPSPSEPSASASTTVESSGNSPVPLKMHVNGQNFVRTKRGNLISAELVAKRRAQREAAAKMHRLDAMVGQISDIQTTRNAAKPSTNASMRRAAKAKTLCAFFNKTGQCKRGLSCPYVHDITKLALCPKVLRPGGCTLPQGTCPLSHTPKPQRVPHCVHYLRTGECRNGIACLYTHSDKLVDGLDTKICRDFSDYGWCDRGENCTERHTYECPDFFEKGKCDRKGCKLLHIIRANADANTQHASSSTLEVNSLQDDDLFMRDDAAAHMTQEEEQQEERKRKRPLTNSDVIPDAQDHDSELDEDTGISFARTGAGRRKKAKAFTQQNDFISFEDADDDIDTVADDDEQDSESSAESDEESVLSEELDVSEDESEPEQDQDQAQGTSDDDRVDRDL